MVYPEVHLILISWKENILIFNFPKSKLPCIASSMIKAEMVHCSLASRPLKWLKSKCVNYFWPAGGLILLPESPKKSYGKILTTWLNGITSTDSKVVPTWRRFPKWPISIHFRKYFCKMEVLLAWGDLAFWIAARPRKGCASLWSCGALK